MAGVKEIGRIVGNGREMWSCGEGAVVRQGLVGHGEDFGLLSVGNISSTTASEVAGELTLRSDVILRTVSEHTEWRCSLPSPQTSGGENQPWGWFHGKARGYSREGKGGGVGDCGSRAAGRGG